MRVIIAGTRTFTDYKAFQSKLFDLFCDYLLKEQELKITEVISGGARGVDKLGMKYASLNKIPCTLFPAEWNKHGLGAGPIRNKRMAEYGDLLIAFWDGKSSGTKNMIEEMQALNKPVHIIDIPVAKPVQRPSLGKHLVEKE